MLRIKGTVSEPGGLTNVFTRVFLEGIITEIDCQTNVKMNRITDLGKIKRMIFNDEASPWSVSCSSHSVL